MVNALSIYSLCQCNSYDFTALRERFAPDQIMFSYRNLLQLRWQDGEVVIFNYGVVVFWNITLAERARLLSLLEAYIQGPLTDLLDDQFTYDLLSSQPSIKNDHISLANNDELTRLSISHGIAQSTKLGQYEARVQKTISSTEHIPKNIANKGKSGLRRKELAKLRGFLFLTKSDVMLNFDLLDVPEFFWEYPEQQGNYSMIADYLEIKPRVEVLNKRLETIQDLLQMVADEQKHSHSAILEWIIIWLIGIDIIIVLLQEFILK